MFGKKKKEPVDLMKMNSSSFSYGANPSPRSNPTVNSPSPFVQNTPYPKESVKDPYARGIRPNVDPDPFGTKEARTSAPKEVPPENPEGKKKAKKEKKTYTPEERKEKRRYGWAMARFVVLVCLSVFLAGYLVYSLVLLFR